MRMSNRSSRASSLRAASPGGPAARRCFVTLSASADDSTPFAQAFDAFLVKLPGGPSVAVKTPLETLRALRPSYPRTLSGDQLGELLNAAAWAHRDQGYGLLSKPNGANCRQPWTGKAISKDILMLAPDGRIFDCLIDAGGVSTPTWHEKAPINPGLFVAAVDPAGLDLPPPPPLPRPPTGGTKLKPYDDALAVEFGQAVNRLYEGSGVPVDAGMIAVQAMRAWHDYQAGMSWPASRDKHVAEFKQATGL